MSTVAPVILLETYSKTCVKGPLSKRPQIGFHDKLSLNAGQKYCRMLQGEHSAILLTFIKLPFVIKIFILSIFEWPFYTGFTVLLNLASSCVNLLNSFYLLNLEACIVVLSLVTWSLCYTRPNKKNMCFPVTSLKILGRVGAHIF